MAQIAQSLFDQIDEAEAEAEHTEMLVRDRVTAGETTGERLWAYLLSWAELDTDDAPAGAYGDLKLVKGAGAQIVQGKPGTYRLVPGDTYAGGVEAWQRDRELCLAPHQGEIAHWLRLIAEGEGETPVRDSEPGNYCYHTVFGFTVQREAGTWTVKDPAGKRVAKAADWRTAIFHAADLRPETGVAA